MENNIKCVNIDTLSWGDEVINSFIEMFKSAKTKKDIGGIDIGGDEEFYQNAFFQ